MPVQAGVVPKQAIVAAGSSLLAIDTADPSARQTLATFPSDTGFDWVRVDRPRGRVFFGVTSGCDPGINGMYVLPLSGGTPVKLSPEGDRASVSPDGTKIAFSVHTDGCGSQDLVVQDVASGQQQRFSGHRSIGVGAWASDGQSLLLVAEGANTSYRFRPFDEAASLDDSEQWDAGRVSDSGGGRVAILDWCSGETSACVVGVRTRPEGTGAGSDYSFGQMQNVDSLSIDDSGQWPLLVAYRTAPTGTDSPAVVLMFTDGQWHELAEGDAADW